MGTIVHTPVEGYNGIVAGVAFVDGCAETDNAAALAYFRRRGYHFGARPAAALATPVADPASDPLAYPEGDPTAKWKLPELKAFADAKEIDLGDATKKPDVLAAILDHLDAADDPAPDGDDVDGDEPAHDVVDDDSEDAGDEPDRA